MSCDLSINSQLVVPPSVISRLVGDETVLLDMASGYYFGLDGVGKRIWESIVEGQTVGQTAAIIANEYEVGLDDAERDILEFLGEMLARGLLDRA